MPRHNLPWLVRKVGNWMTRSRVCVSKPKMVTDLFPPYCRYTLSAILGAPQPPPLPETSPSSVIYLQSDQ